MGKSRFYRLVSSKKWLLLLVTLKQYIRKRIEQLNRIVGGSNNVLRFFQKDESLKIYSHSSFFCLFFIFFLIGLKATFRKIFLFLFFLNLLYFSWIVSTWFFFCLATINAGDTIAGNSAFPLLSALARPAGQPPSGDGKQLDNSSPFGGLISGIFNQALSNFGRPAANANVMGSNVGTTGNWNSFFTSTDTGKQPIISSNSIVQQQNNINMAPSLFGVPGWWLLLGILFF